MVIIPVKIEAKSPINVGARRAYGHVTETMAHIPSGVIRGAFATFLYRQNPALFRSLYLPIDSIRFSDFYPVPPFVASGGLESQIPGPLPMTAITCKHYPGFITQQDWLGRIHPQEVSSCPVHGVFDTLLVEVAYDCLQFPSNPLRHVCHSCQAPAEPFDGPFQSLFPSERSISPFDRASHRPHARGTFFRQPVHPYFLGRTAINRGRQTAQEGLLYALEVIPERTCFMGSIGLPEDGSAVCQQIILAALEEVSAVGADTTAGLGQVSIESHPDQQRRAANDEAVEARIMAFDSNLEAVRAYCRSMYGGEDTGIDNNGIYFTVDLQTPAVFFGHMGEPSAHLSKELLSRHCGGGHAFESVAAFARHQLIGGWSLPWQLPKEMRLAASAGSVYVFKVNTLTAELVAVLTRLEGDGVGEYRDEGFGQVLICPPFHQEVLPV